MIVVLLIWTGLIIFYALCIFNLKVDFRITYFIGPDAAIRGYIDRQEQYYRMGDTVTFYTDNTELDYTTVETQQ